MIFLPSNAIGQIQSITTVKSQYYEGETISFSGKVVYNENIPSLILRVLNPSESDFVFITQLILNSDGSFNGSFVADGPKWSSEGPYKVLVNYGSDLQEKIIQFNFKSESNDIPKTTPKEFEQKEKEISNANEMKLDSVKTQDQNLKNKLSGFPSLDKSPQYYFDRYYFEEDYRKWFNTQFPNESIYSVLGFMEPVRVPEWIKMNAGWWSTGKISDSDFVQGSQYMLDNNIIILNGVSDSSFSGSEIPHWVRNVANWWSADLISEAEFVQSLRYLIAQGIVVVN